MALPVTRASWSVASSPSRALCGPGEEADAGRLVGGDGEARIGREAGGGHQPHRRRPIEPGPAVATSRRGSGPRGRSVMSRTSSPRLGTLADVLRRWPTHFAGPASSAPARSRRIGRRRVVQPEALQLVPVRRRPVVGHGTSLPDLSTRSVPGGVVQARVGSAATFSCRSVAQRSFTSSTTAHQPGSVSPLAREAGRGGRARDGCCAALRRREPGQPLVVGGRVGVGRLAPVVADGIDRPAPSR